MQSNQEAFAVDVDETVIFPGSSTTRGGDTAEPGEEGVGASRARRGGQRHRIHVAIQSVVDRQVHVVVLWTEVN